MSMTDATLGITDSGAEPLGLHRNRSFDEGQRSLSPQEIRVTSAVQKGATS